MRKDICQSLFQKNDISSKHEQTIERTCQMNSPGIGLDDLDISPLVSFYTPSCVYGNFRANLDADHFTRWAYYTNEVRKTATWSATHIENTIALF